MKRAFPNPFNPRTFVSYQLASGGRVTVAVYDLRGRLVQTLWDGEQGGGSHQLYWNGRDASGNEMPSGSYLIQMTTATHRQTQKVVLLR